MDNHELTVSEYAKLQGVTEKTVYRWLANHRIPGARKTPGGQWRIADPRREVPSGAVQA